MQTLRPILRAALEWSALVILSIIMGCAYAWAV